jgi:hypothetical protein
VEVPDVEADYLHREIRSPLRVLVDSGLDAGSDELEDVVEGDRERAEIVVRLAELTTQVSLIVERASSKVLISDGSVSSESRCVVSGVEAGAQRLAGAAFAAGASTPAPPTRTATAARPAQRARLAFMPTERKELLNRTKRL